MDDCLILGGGVIGLSLAYELAGSGARVSVIDRGAPGQEASWAGAGILPPAVRRPSDSSLEQLAGLSHALHPQWAERLRAETGVDNGFRRSGGIYLARGAVDAESLHRTAGHWRQQEIVAECLAMAQLEEMEPALQLSNRRSPIDAAYLLPDEAQIRNPRHLKALLAACLARGVRIVSGVAVEDFELRGERLERVRTSAGDYAAEKICVTTGSWTQGLLARLGLEVRMKPIRGQMLLLSSMVPLMTRIVNEGRRYLVPRADGRLLVGSTEEDVGFQKQTTAEGLAGLLRLALELAPGLGSAQLEKTWSGLRPSTFDGLPYLGPLPGIDNAYVAAGHFRAGLHLSPGTAVVMSELIQGRTPQIDLSPFRVDRS